MKLVDRKGGGVKPRPCLLRGSAMGQLRLQILKTKRETSKKNIGII